MQLSLLQLDFKLLYGVWKKEKPEIFRQEENVFLTLKTVFPDLFYLLSMILPLTNCPFQPSLNHPHNSAAHPPFYTSTNHFLPSHDDKSKIFG